jgi:hypothetical protein
MGLNLSTGTSVAYVPPVEGTAEFKVQNTSYDAQYGGTTGGVINITTKSGGNEWHGSLFEFLQNTHLNANTFNNNLDGIPRQSSHINTFGGDFGGPIKHDKLFFEFAYENIRQVIPDPFVTSVPTAAQRTGDFSQTFFAANSVQTIYDPYTTATGAGGALVRTPFAGNVIPTARINPSPPKCWHHSGRQCARHRNHQPQQPGLQRVHTQVHRFLPRVHRARHYNYLG